MKVGKKATGQSSIDKMCVTRHGNGGGKRAANAEEKAIETRVRRAGKKQANEFDKFEDFQRSAWSRWNGY